MYVSKKLAIKSINNVGVVSLWKKEWMEILYVQFLIQIQYINRTHIICYFTSLNHLIYSVSNHTNSVGETWVRIKIKPKFACANVTVVLINVVEHSFGINLMDKMYDKITEFLFRFQSCFYRYVDNIRTSFFLFR